MAKGHFFVQLVKKDPRNPLCQAVCIDFVVTKQMKFMQKLLKLLGLRRFGYNETKNCYQIESQLGSMI